MWKLVAELSFQLHHLRYGKQWIKKVSGFCVPVKRCSYVELVECNWNDDNLHHKITVTPLDKDEAANHILGVHDSYTV